MLVNLPKKMISTMIGRELMKYMIKMEEKVDDAPPAGVLMHMGNINVSNGAVQIKYFPIVPNSEFLKYFKKNESRDDEVYYIPREVVMRFYTEDESLSNTEIIEYAKLVTSLSNYIDSHPYEDSQYFPPINIPDSDTEA